MLAKSTIGVFIIEALLFLEGLWAAQFANGDGLIA